MKKSARSLNEKISLAYLIGAIIILVAFLGSFFFIRWPHPWTLVFAALSIVWSAWWVYHVTNRHK